MSLVASTCPHARFHPLLLSRFTSRTATHIAEHSLQKSVARFASPRDLANVGLGVKGDIRRLKAPGSRRSGEVVATGIL